MNINTATTKEKIQAFTADGDFYFEHGYRTPFLGIVENKVRYRSGWSYTLDEMKEEDLLKLWHTICEYVVYCQCWA